MPDSNIYALKGDTRSFDYLLPSLAAGVGRFGWSYTPGCDLHVLKSRIELGGRKSLSAEEENSWQPFLLNLKAEDWVIYVNVPEWGRCTMAQVAGPYFWEWEEGDFNHRFRIDPSTIQEFGRNDVSVPPYLSQRLKLQGRYWQIYADKEFQTLLANLAADEVPQLRTPQSSAALLGKNIEPMLRQITEQIYRTHPNYDFEALLELVFRSMPSVRRVVRQGGAGDHGADLIVEYESGLPITALQTQHTCVVQAKSFVGAHWDTQAVKDIERAFERYPTADVGLIVSTAEASTPVLDAAIDTLRISSGRRVELLIGADVARLLLKFGSALLG